MNGILILAVIFSLASVIGFVLVMGANAMSSAPGRTTFPWVSTVLLICAIFFWVAYWRGW